MNKISITINGIKTLVPKNITVLQACQKLNIQIPKFCFQENLKIAGNCRMCLVEIKNSPKPQASCALPVMPGMEIFTNTPLVQKARESVLEFILINHPLDCPICDQASECDLQDQTMSFGSDRSRFFFKKRGVENKNVGPFIKTIMTRCIHCTRCVRFAEEICRDDHFGTTGRGTKTEINFYNSNIFFSEFSGNLIDLCPVGALTSKPFAFKVRSWELKKKEGVDILDGLGSNINIDIFQNNIIRILPKTNLKINKEWISNKTRFFFDSLKYQRVEKPLLKVNNTFKEISWDKALNILHKEIITRHSNEIEGIVGNLTDIKSQFLFKKFLNSLGIKDISYLFPNKNENFFNTDISSNYLFSNLKNNIENSDLILILNNNIREEGSILNIHILNRLQKGDLVIASIGPKFNYTYNIEHLGFSFNILNKIINGQHSFCKKIKKAKNPIIIIGTNVYFQKNGKFILNNFKTLSFLTNKNFNTLHTQSSYLNFLEIYNNKYNFKKNKKTLYFLYNTDFEKKINKKNNFIIYQGHHFTKNAQEANLILPGLSFLEKKGIYINTEGFLQKNEIILKRKTQQKNDTLIFQNILLYFQIKNKIKILDSKILFKNLYSYIFSKQINTFNFSILYSNYYKNLNLYTMKILNKKIYIQNILEKHSRVLINSQNILKNKSNFKL